MIQLHLNKSPLDILLAYAPDAHLSGRAGGWRMVADKNIILEGRKILASGYDTPEQLFLKALQTV